MSFSGRPLSWAFGLTWGLLLAGCATVAQPPAVRHQVSGQEFPLDAFRGHVVLLNIWAMWCKPCLVEVPELTTLAREFRGEVLFVAVYYQAESTAGPQVTSWLRMQPEYFEHQVAWGNSAFHERFPHRVLPTTYVIGRDGAVVRKFEGAMMGETRIGELRAAIEQGLRQPRPVEAAAR